MTNPTNQTAADVLEKLRAWSMVNIPMGSGTFTKDDQLSPDEALKQLYEITVAVLPEKAEYIESETQRDHYYKLGRNTVVYEVTEALRQVFKQGSSEA